jgi:hypothetical protein
MGFDRLNIIARLTEKNQFSWDLFVKSQKSSFFQYPFEPSNRRKKLFSPVDEWQDRLAAKEPSPDNNDFIQPTVAANAFVQVMVMPW